MAKKECGDGQNDEKNEENEKNAKNVNQIKTDELVRWKLERKDKEEPDNWGTKCPAKQPQPTTTLTVTVTHSVTHHLHILYFHIYLFIIVNLLGPAKIHSESSNI
jgi:hypothetical protein